MELDFYHKRWVATNIFSWMKATQKQNDETSGWQQENACSTNNSPKAKVPNLQNSWGGIWSRQRTLRCRCVCVCVCMCTCARRTILKNPPWSWRLASPNPQGRPQRCQGGADVAAGAWRQSTRRTPCSQDVLPFFPKGLQLNGCGPPTLSWAICFPQRPLT